MYFAIGVDPTKDIDLMLDSSNIASTTSLSPCITLKTQLGNPASFSNSAIIIEAVGSVGLGFKMKQLPDAIAKGYIHMGTITGKLNGVMPATIPNG